MDNDIVVIKLSDGNDVIAKVVDEDANTLTIVKPRVFVNGREGVAIVPWSLLTEDSEEIVLTKSLVLCILRQPRDKVKEVYVQSTSEIAVVQNKLIV